MKDNNYKPVMVFRRIMASASDIFRILADPRLHPDLDGSGMLRGVASGAVITGVGDVFVMRMHAPRLGDYEMNNHVVEYEPDRRIGWEPQAGRGHPRVGSTWGQRWSYELTPDGPDATIVTEIYDCSRAPKNERARVDNGNAWIDTMTKTLVILDALSSRATFPRAATTPDQTKAPTIVGPTAMEVSMSIGNLPKVVSQEEWLAARKELLETEKELTSARDRLNADRRRLPMLRIDKPYTFEGPQGTVSLGDLFEGRPQLVMHHFMWLFDIDADGNEHPRDYGCSSCSSAADGIPQQLRQLHVRNTTLVAVTRAPYDKIAAFGQRMGWTFPWYSSWGSDFNYDFHATVDERVAPVRIFYRSDAELAAAGMPYTEKLRGDWPAISTFLRVEDDVFHTYSTFGRGIEEFHNGDNYLDLTALGRQEAWEEPDGRATPLGLHVGGPNMRLPDEYDT